MECRKCKQEKRENEFNWKNKTEGKRQTVCSVCSATAGKQYRELHGEQYAEKRRQKYQENIEKVRAGRREDYAKNREKYLEQNRKWKEENPEKYHESRSKTYANHRTEKVKSNDKYREENREKLNANARKHYAKKIQDPVWREKERLRSIEKNRDEKLRVLEAYGKECACCGETEILFLTIDHIDGNGNEQRRQLGIPGGNAFYRFLRKAGYPQGYQVLCFNCNAGKHLNNGICPHKTNLKEN